jgi:hypothetical protein
MHWQDFHIHYNSKSTTVRGWAEGVMPWDSICHSLGLNKHSARCKGLPLEQLATAGAVLELTGCAGDDVLEVQVELQLNEHGAGEGLLALSRFSG